MRSVPRGVLLLAALTLPVVAVLLSFALTSGPRTPHVPEGVRIGSAPGAGTTVSGQTPKPRPTIDPAPRPQHPAELPPPAPDDDGDDDGADGDDD